MKLKENMICADSQEKQAESIVEKLCQRFRDATEERQWRDISFCLSLLPFKSERSMKKLIDGCARFARGLTNKLTTGCRSTKTSCTSRPCTRASRRSCRRWVSFSGRASALTIGTGEQEPQQARDGVERV